MVGLLWRAGMGQLYHVQATFTMTSPAELTDEQAWNMKPTTNRQKWTPTAEFCESFLIFFYGITNIFLEHLGGWGGKWNAQDLEHVSITVLFIGGGLVSSPILPCRRLLLLSTSLLRQFAVWHASRIHLHPRFAEYDRHRDRSCAS
jgi:hypothetical protein